MQLQKELKEKNPDEKYDLIVLTDIFELSDDISCIIQFDRAKDHCSKKLSPVKLQKR